MGPHARFARWFAATGRSKEEVARDLGCTGVYVGYLLAGARTPGLKIAFAIERATADWSEGPIEARDWIRVTAATGTDGQ